MLKDRGVLVAYRLLEFPNETPQSWPIARVERDELPIRLLPTARDAGPRNAGSKKIPA